MKCPICLVDLVMTERQGVEIDYCPTCRGIWLDRGELDKIIEKSLVGNAPVNMDRPQSQPQFQRDDSQHGHDSHKVQGGYYGGHRKKSLLGEIFDF